MAPHRRPTTVFKNRSYAKTLKIQSNRLPISKYSQPRSEMTTLAAVSFVAAGTRFLNIAAGRAGRIVVFAFYGPNYL